MKQIKDFIQLMLHEVGYSSLEELVQNSVAWKHKISSLYLLSVSLGGFITGIYAFTEEYIYSPAMGIIVLFAVSLIDLLLGMSVAIDEKKGISPARIVRSLVRFIVQVVFVGLIYEMSSLWHILIQSWMVDSLLIIFTLSTFWSAVQNAAKLKLITPDQYSFIEGIVNLKGLIERFTKKQ